MGLRPAGILGLLVLSAVGGACASDESRANTNDGKLSVVAGFYPLAEVAAQVGADRVEVTNLTTPGTEAHDVELTPDQVDRVHNADVVLYLGNGFQHAVEDAVDGRSRDGAVDLLKVTRPTTDDPHVWLDVGRMKSIVDEIERALVDIDPSAAADAEYAANADTYRATLATLDDDFRAGLGTCKRREIVTAHEAFGYLAERYDLEQHAVTGLEPEAEPDPQRLAELADEIRAKGVTTVFTETLASPAIAEALAREANVRTVVLDPIEGITEERQRGGATYVTVMRENLEALRSALECT